LAARGKPAHHAQNVDRMSTFVRIHFIIKDLSTGIKRGSPPIRQLRHKPGEPVAS
jgi:hypothetical protein